MKPTFFKKLLFSLIILIGISSPSIAQDVKVKWGMESDGGDKKSISEPMGWYEGFYYNLRLDYAVMSNKYDIVIEKINTDMKIVSIKEVAYESSPAKLLEYSKFIDGKIYLFSTTYEGKLDKLNLFYDAFNLDGNKLTEKRIASFPMKNRLLYLPMKFSISPDKSIICGVFSESSKKGEPLKINTINIPTNNIDAATTTSQKIVYSGDQISVSKQQVDNSQNIFLLIHKQDGKKEDPEVTLYIVDNKGTISKEQKLEYKNYSLGNVDMIAAEDGTIKLAGIYFNKDNKKTFYKGFFLSTFNPSDYSFSKFSTAAFDSKIIKYYGKKAERKGTAKIGGQFNIKLYPSENNVGGFIVAENLTIASKSYVEYNFLELLVMDYNDNEELGDIKFIPKFQYDSYRAPSVNPLPGITITFSTPYAFQKLMEIYTSYSAFVNDGDLFIMFNDDEKNAEAKSMDDVEKMYNPSKGVTMLYTLADDGVLKKKIWFDNKEKDGFFTPSKTYDKGDVKVIGISEKKSMRYGKLSFQ